MPQVGLARSARETGSVLSRPDELPFAKFTSHVEPGDSIVALHVGASTIGSGNAVNGSERQGCPESCEADRRGDCNSMRCGNRHSLCTIRSSGSRSAPPASVSASQIWQNPRAPTRGPRYRRARSSPSVLTVQLAMFGRPDPGSLAIGVAIQSTGVAATQFGKPASTPTSTPSTPLPSTSALEIRSGRYAVAANRDERAPYP